MRLDVGFADAVTPPPNELGFPTLLENMEKPCIRAYPPETVIAEKYQAFIDLGMFNSRMKDFYDLWFMPMSMGFDYPRLAEAVSKTFAQRKTTLPEEIPTAFTEESAIQKQELWSPSVRKVIWAMFQIISLR